MTSRRLCATALVVLATSARVVWAITTCVPAVAGSALPATPRELDAKAAFEAMVTWVHDEIVVRRKAPGLVVGLSGTDSLLAFLVASEAFTRAGRPDRVAGVHFAPSEDFVDDHPEAAGHLWFQEKIVPWLKGKAPKARIEIDSSIDWRKDGLRWGALMEWSVSDPHTRAPRPKDQRYWVMGTRNATEEALFTYSNASMPVSVQPMTHLWKSEVLRLAKWLGVPEIAVDKACEVDCVCGRRRLPATHIAEVDALLMTRAGLLAPSYVERTLPPKLRAELERWIEEQIEGSRFKAEIPFSNLAPSIPTDDAKLEALDGIRERLGSGSADVRAFSKWVPAIVADGRPNVAAELVTLPSPNREAWLPEALALFRTPGLLPTQKRQMLGAVFTGGVPKGFGELDVAGWARVSGRLGGLGFRFPQWRFLAQRTGEAPTLAERFGLRRLLRANDVRDPALPPDDPQRDELGPGFARQTQDGYVEWRRSYVVSALGGDVPVVVVKRNDSHFFGRDRLPSTAWVSFEPWTAAELRALDGSALDHSGKFLRFTDALLANGAIVDERLRRIGKALNALDALDGEIDRWLRTAEGTEALTALLAPRVSKHLSLALVRGDGPSWQLEAQVPVTAAFVADLRARGPEALPPRGPGVRLVVVSGARGDFP